MWRGGLGAASLLPALSSAGASIGGPSARYDRYAIFSPAVMRCFACHIHCWSH
jgi:hypothetical protein